MEILREHRVCGRDRDITSPDFAVFIVVKYMLRENKDKRGPKKKKRRGIKKPSKKIREKKEQKKQRKTLTRKDVRLAKFYR